MEQEYLFISGPPRSGTTLLELIISSHSAVTITPESLFIGKVILKKYMTPKMLGISKKKEIFKLMKADKKLNSWPGFAFDDEAEAVLNDKQTLGDLLGATFKLFADRNNGGTKYLGNKKGLYAEEQGILIKKLFPNAKFIYIVRDPRDVTRSILKNLKNRDLVGAAEICSRRFYYINKIKNRYPQDVEIVKYEDLVTEPKITVSRICSFLDLQYEKCMLEFYKQNQDGSRLLSITENIHQNTRYPLNPALIGQWEKESFFSADELKIIEDINYYFMIRLNYSLKTPSIYWTRKLIAYRYYLKHIIKTSRILAEFHLK